MVGKRLWPPPSTKGYLGSMRLPFVLLSLAAAWASDKTPVLLELFTSQGCSSCPPADRLLATLDQKQPVDGVDLIVLSEHVDYWNHLGWTDPFSSPFFSARQNDYVTRFRLQGPYTPQLVIDGQIQLVGSDTGGVLNGIERARQFAKSKVTLTNAKRDGDRISVHVNVDALPDAVKKGTLYLALAEAGAQSQVPRGENAGRALAHVAVVRSLTPVGQIRPGQGFDQDVAANLKPGTGAAGLRVIAFVEDAGTRRIVGAAQIRL